jgi:hypothetical protein
MSVGFTYDMPHSLAAQSIAEPQELPKVKSKVLGVSLENVRFADFGGGNLVLFDIVNNTKKPILSVTVRSGNNYQTYNAYGDEAFIMPGAKSDEGRYNLKNMRTGTLTVAAVEFVDGEMIGTEFDKEQLRDMKKRKAEGKAPKALKSTPKRGQNQ